MHQAFVDRITCEQAHDEPFETGETQYCIKHYIVAKDTETLCERTEVDNLAAI